MSVLDLLEPGELSDHALSRQDQSESDPNCRAEQPGAHVPPARLATSGGHSGTTPTRAEQLKFTNGKNR